MKEEHLATADQKLAYWGYGEWVEEPDLVEWEYKGVKCLIVRNFHVLEDACLGLGHLCGYIFLPQEHPWATSEDLDAECGVHGGITFQEIEEGFFKIGFDCAHYQDEIPYSDEKSLKFLLSRVDKDSDQYIKTRSSLESITEINKRLSSFIERHPKSYKNIAFVKSQCESLVDQALAIKVE